MSEQKRSFINESIAAIATAPGEAAIAMIRISGHDVLQIADAIFRGKEKPSQMKPRYVSFGKIVRDEKIIDDVLLTVFKAPASYTGEDVVEICGHGGPLVVRAVLETVLAAGARAARPGEFTQRAYLNGKMDLTQAEAIMDLISAQTSRAQRSASEQLAGRLGEAMKSLRSELLQSVAHLEAFLDFPEEDISPEHGETLRLRVEKNRNQLLQMLSTADEGRLLRNGFRLALCGAPNAGKSSLLNRLLGIERAIVSNIPGTTRDSIEESASLGGFPFRLVDTAGLRVTEDPIEKEGVSRAQKLAEEADLCLHLVDISSSQESIPSITEHELLVLNKIDLLEDRALLEKKFPAAVAISCITGEGMEQLTSAIIERVTNRKSRLSENNTSSVFINARHAACLNRALQSLDQGLALLNAEQPPELLAVELHGALDAIGEVTGEANTEEILGEIFGQFCIGK